MDLPSIGIFNDSFPPIYDGVTLTVQNYCKYLALKGSKITVVTPWNPQSDEYPFDIIRYFSLPIRSRKPYRYGYPKIDPFIWPRLRSTPFSLVHCHCPFSSGRLGVYVKKKQGVPLIATFHSKYREDLKHSFRRMPFFVDIIMRRILDFLNACDEVWIPQAEVEDTVREYGYRGPLTVVENGIDFSAPDDIGAEKSRARKEIGLGDDCLGLLFVGQHIFEKGVDVIIDTLHRLKGRIRFKMNFIGVGYALDEMKRRIMEYGLSEDVEFHGIITDRRILRNYYAGSDIFIFPSMYDNAPLVVREAAAFGTPSILPEGSTASHVITDGITGFVARRDAWHYADRILNLCENRSGILKAGICASHTIVRSWEDVVGEVEDRYRIICKKKL